MHGCAAEIFLPRRTLGTLSYRLILLLNLRPSWVRRLREDGSWSYRLQPRFASKLGALQAKFHVIRRLSASLLVRLLLRVPAMPRFY
jgi:hypothetical protein